MGVFYENEIEMIIECWDNEKYKKLTKEDIDMAVTSLIDNENLYETIINEITTTLDRIVERKGI